MYVYSDYNDIYLYNKIENLYNKIISIDGMDIKNENEDYFDYFNDYGIDVTEINLDPNKIYTFISYCPDGTTIKSCNSLNGIKKNIIKESKEMLEDDIYYKETMHETITMLNNITKTHHSDLYAYGPYDYKCIFRIIDNN